MISVRRLFRLCYFAALGLEVLFAFLLSMFVVWCIPFRIYHRWITHFDKPLPAPELISRDLRRIISFLAPILPARNACLISALAAKAMLARRGYGSVLSLGVANGPTELKAHAWLSAGAVIVTGREEMKDYREVTTL